MTHQGEGAGGAAVGSVTPGEILAFWRDAGPDRWFSKDEAFDEECLRRFLLTFEAAARGDLNEWELSPEGSLALLILLDQLPRNMFRGTRRVWATDDTARLAAERALEKGFDAAVDPPMRQFFYLPFMHAEDLAAQERSVALSATLDDETSLTFARHHQDVIRRFGRFPHRNEVLGRATTPEELAFLEEDGFRG
jgi:uncharacterized protein (DUF924 family)